MPPLGSYFSDLWAKEEENSTESRNPMVNWDDYTEDVYGENPDYPVENWQDAMMNWHPGKYGSKLLEELGLMDRDQGIGIEAADEKYGFADYPEGKKLIDTGIYREEMKRRVPMEFETASPDETSVEVSPELSDYPLAGGVPVWSRPRPPVDRKELARSDRNNSGILGALKKYAPSFGAATVYPRGRFGE